MPFPVITIVAIAICYVILLHHSSYDVKVVPGKFKIRFKEIEHEGVETVFYQLYVCEPLFLCFHHYKLAGSKIQDVDFGFKNKVDFKFNSIEDAERYYSEYCLK
jgi:hypothetical protein